MNKKEYSQKPPENRKKPGPIAIIECNEKIPCNVCVEACPQDAISIGEEIIELPKINKEKCTGCALCVNACPGQAIYVLNYDYSDEEASVTIPYEFLPIPSEGDTVKALDKTGNVICRAEIVKIRSIDPEDPTKIVTISVPKKYAEKTRTIKIEEENNE